MYIARVHRIQEVDIPFSDDDYDDWVMMNPGISHSHEKYVEEIVQNMVEIDEFWATNSAEIVCILYSRDDRE